MRLKKYALKLTSLAAVILSVAMLPLATACDDGVKPDDNDYVDVFIFMGQSNMSGQGKAEEAVICGEGHGYEYRAVSGNDTDGWLYPVAEPFGITERNDAISDVRTGGLVSAFCESYYQTTGVPVVGVSASKSASSITFWEPGTDAYKEAVSRLKSCVTYLNEETDRTVRNVSMVWCQGETDAWVTEYNNFPYIDKLTALYEGLHSEAFVEFCFIITPSMYTDGNAIEYKRKLAEKQVNLCMEKDEFILASRKFENVPLNLRDDPHYCQAVYNLCGWEAGKTAGTFIETDVELICDVYREGEAEELAQSLGLPVSYNPNAS